MTAEASTGRNERVCLIVNPRSAAGATGQRVEQVRELARARFGELDLKLTERPGHARELATQAVAEGHDLVVSVGGDGTAHEVVNGMLAQGPDPSAAFAVVPAGTGSDLVKTLGVPTDLEAALDVAAFGEERACDAVRVRCQDAAGDERTCIGINVIGFGMNGDVVYHANRSSKRFGGKATFLGATLRSMLTYRAAPVALRWTDAGGREGEMEMPLMAAFLANGQYCGGGMWVGRGGAMDDGLLDLTLIPRLPTARLLRGLPYLFNGQMETVDGVVRMPVRHLEARCMGPRPMGIDVDGEQAGVLPVHLEVVPRAVRMRGKWAV